MHAAAPAGILTARLDLRPMTHAFLQATAADDRREATRLLGAEIPTDWPGDAPLETWLQRAPAEDDLPWLARAVVLRESSTMIGHAGFHMPPGSPHLEPWAPGGVEIGYTIFEAHRRRGYATEAVRGLVSWARERGVATVLATTEPGNVGSAAVLQQCGFVAEGKTSTEADAEDVWVLRSPA